MDPQNRTHAIRNQQFLKFRTHFKCNFIVVSLFGDGDDDVFRLGLMFALMSEFRLDFWFALVHLVF